MKAAGSAGSVEMLVTYVIHTEQQRRYQRNNHHRHDAFAVDGVVNMRSRFRSGVGHEQNVSKPSNTERNAWNLPPSSKFGFILSR